MATGLDFLAIGHVTLDLTQEGKVPGGTAFYAAVTAARLGKKVGLLTRGAPPQSKEPLAALEQVVNIPSPVTTIFENRYANGVRIQRLHSAAPSIEGKHLPDGWQDVPMVLFSSCVSRSGKQLGGVLSQSAPRRRSPGLAPSRHRYWTY